MCLKVILIEALLLRVLSLLRRRWPGVLVCAGNSLKISTLRLLEKAKKEAVKEFDFEFYRNFPGGKES